MKYISFVSVASALGPPPQVVSDFEELVPIGKEVLGKRSGVGAGDHAGLQVHSLGGK